MNVDVIVCLKQVEESFNVQATHDLIYKSWMKVSSFDHISFPGVVPRTFLGPLTVIPIPLMVLKAVDVSPFVMLHVVRLTLGCFTVLSLLSVQRALSRRFTSLSGKYFCLLTIAQFHILFYASRPLPNIFALILTNVSLCYRIDAKSSLCIYRSLSILAFATALFRSELSLLLFSALVLDLILRRISLVAAVSACLSYAIPIALVSIVVDSYFWGRLCYPELEVFYFNVFLNKSSEWGTSPYHWYLTNALPRVMNLSLPLSLYSLCTKGATRSFALPFIMFIVIYSILPHKETRFILYAIPALNACSAVALDDAMRHIRGGGKRKYKPVSMTIVLLGIGALCVGTMQLCLSTIASRGNYAGGWAMRHLHEQEDKLWRNVGRCGEEAHVHVSVGVTETGWTQYGEHRNGCVRWHYSKEEGMNEDMLRARGYEYLVRETGMDVVGGYTRVGVETGYGGMDWGGGRIRWIEKVELFRRDDLNISSAVRVR